LRPRKEKGIPKKEKGNAIHSFDEPRMKKKNKGNGGGVSHMELGVSRGEETKKRKGAKAKKERGAATSRVPEKP